MAIAQLICLSMARAAEKAAEAFNFLTHAFVDVICWSWRVCVQVHLAVIEWVDEQLPEFGIADSPLLRAVVTGLMGATWSTGLVLTIAWLQGLWGLVLVFVVGVGFSVVVGVMADPDKDWSFVAPKEDGGPRIPLNL